MSQKPINAESPLEEQLVAYLDGELDSQSCRRIEELLAIDPEVRRKLHWFEQTWEMLDELDTAPVGEDFTRTTLEIVALAADQDVRKIAEKTPQRRRRMWFLASAALLLTGMAGFMAVLLTARNPNRQLLRDLPVLEKLDEYRQIKDIRFLSLLKENGLFANEENITSGQPAADRGEENIIQHLKSLGASEKNELLRKNERFTGYSQSEQNQLRQLYDQIRQDPHPEELHGIIDRYYQWYKSLPAYSRSDLNALSEADKRIDWIKKRLLEDQTKISNRPPTAKDADALVNWMQKYAENHEKQFIEGLPQWLQKDISRMPAAARRRAIMWMMWQRPPGGAGRQIQLSESELMDLISAFTANARKLLETQNPAGQFHTIQNWAHYILRQSHGPGMRGLVDEGVLEEFFEKDLTPEQRDRLMNLSGDDMQRELVRMYMAQTRPPERHPPQPDEFRPGPPPDGFPPPDRPDSEKTQNQ